jgi:hypothetical protein
MASEDGLPLHFLTARRDKEDRGLLTEMLVDDSHPVYQPFPLQGVVPGVAASAVDGAAAAAAASPRSPGRWRCPGPPSHHPRHIPRQGHA